MLQNLSTAYQGLEFEPETHTYTVGGRILTPVSNSLKSYYEEFNVEEKAVEYAQRHGGDPDEIAQAWEDNRVRAAEFGTSVHNFGERYFLDHSLKPSNNHEVAITKFWKDIPPYIIPLHSELQMFSERFALAGTSDNIFYDDRKKGIVISDYKTNKDLYKNFMGKTMFEPFEFMLDMPLSHYELQLSTYQLLLEEAIGVKVVERWIIWLLPDGSYEKIYARDFSKQIKEQRLKQLSC